MTEKTVALSISECSKRPSSKAAASEGARRTLRYDEPLSDARTPLENFFSILLGGGSRAATLTSAQEEVHVLVRTRTEWEKEYSLWPSQPVTFCI